MRSTDPVAALACLLVAGAPGDAGRRPVEGPEPAWPDWTETAEIVLRVACLLAGMLFFPVTAWTITNQPPEKPSSTSSSPTSTASKATRRTLPSCSVTNPVTAAPLVETSERA